ncbi:hypothetical protein CJW20_12585 [Salmonella enterica]|nr:hypothetical protein [Salmonella enterica]EDU8780412.1 hypothetical protein [Salmonella enterica subsp. enterica]EBE5877326.1 hypothetical protein [Salmonella enterica]EBH6321642.1 hypothetical protein [Salmonella enterica]EBI6522905.1 hypothetical protein [Salmonella enterica]
MTDLATSTILSFILTELVNENISPKQSLYSDCLEVVNMGVLTEDLIYFIWLISQLMAKAIPVRGAKFREADVH